MTRARLASTKSATTNNTHRNSDRIKIYYDTKISNDDFKTCALDKNTSETDIIFVDTRQYDVLIHHVYICTQDVIQFNTDVKYSGTRFNKVLATQCIPI